MGLDKLIEYLLQFIELFKFWVVIPINKRGVRLRLGENPIELKEGFHFIRALGIDKITSHIVTPEWGQSQPVFFTTSDLKTAVVIPCLKYKIVDIIKWTYSENDALSNLYEILQVSTLEILSDCNWDECLRKTTYTKIKNKIKDKADSLGVEVLDFGLNGLSLCKIIITKI